MRNSLLVFSGVLAFIVLLFIGKWACFGADQAGRVVERTFDADNVLYSYERFFDMNAEYNTRVSQANELQTYLDQESDPVEIQRLRTDVMGQRQSCRQLAEEYNADAQKLNRGLFLADNLPPSLDPASCG